MKYKHILSSLLLLLLATATYAQDVDSQMRIGQIVEETIQSPSIKESLSGENPERHVLVYLPPSYSSDQSKRYPVLYLLHGIGDTDSVWVSGQSQLGNIQSVLDEGINSGRFGEMIVVMPDQRTNWFGSFYVNSTVTGNWEDFTAKELVAHIDKKYRTLAGVSNRAIAGHSMGGYGAITLGMKHPDVFSVVYGMNPALIEWNRDLSIGNTSLQNAIHILQNASSYQEILQSQDFFAVGLLTVSLAFSPNPSSSPFFVDLPYQFNGSSFDVKQPGFSKWTQNFPSHLAQVHRDNLLKLKAIKFDSGYEDEYLFIPEGARQFSNTLTALSVSHIFEEYNGDHRNKIWGLNGRMLTEVLPFVWYQLNN